MTLTSKLPQHQPAVLANLVNLSSSSLLINLDKSVGGKPRNLNFGFMLPAFYDAASVSWHGDGDCSRWAERGEMGNKVALFCLPVWGSARSAVEACARYIVTSSLEKPNAGSG